MSMQKLQMSISTEARIEDVMRKHVTTYMILRLSGTTSVFGPLVPDMEVSR